MELRKVCQHPYLSAPELEIFDLPLEEQHRQLVNASGKLQFLKLLLPKLIARGHRILLFSQFKMALDRIQDFLYGENVKHLRLDGDTQQAQRQKYMDQFNAPNSDYHIFLLTTRAGGVGINLASADTIILHDPDFNPHQDQQAIARAYRYGQKKEGARIQVDDQRKRGRNHHKQREKKDGIGPSGRPTNGQRNRRK